MVRCCTLTLLLSLSTVTIVRADISLSGDASFASGAAIVGPTAEGRIVATPPSTVTSSRLSIGPTGSPPVRYDSEVLIDGATWTATGQVTVGAGGALTVRGGGSFVQTSGEATFGSPSGLASLTVDGAGSDARFQTGFQFGNGTIEVRNGARLQTPAATLGAATEGNLAGSIDVQIDGPGAEWNPVGSTRIAAGELKVTGGARVDGAGLSLGSTGLSVVARFAGEAGAPSRLGGFTVGDQGYANLLVEEGADISATSTAIGGPAEGIVTLTGRGTTWTTNTLSIGGGKSSSSGGAGELRVLDGATFSANVSEQLQLAFNSGETVRILVDGIDSKLLLSGFRSNTSPAIGLGQRGYAQFIVSGGARQTSGRLTIGSTDTRSNGLVRIIGEGSQWDVGGADVVRGRLELLDSAVMTLTTTGATVGATGVIQLSEGGRIRSGALSSSSSLPSVQNQGLITGSGVIDLPVVNSANGRVVVGPGDRLQVAVFTNSTSSSLELNGGTLIVPEGVNDLSLINRGNILIENGKIEATSARSQPNRVFRNEAPGVVRFVGGSNSVKGAFENLAGRVIVSGDSTLRFFDPVSSSGAGLFSVSQGSTAFFLGGYSGNGVRGDGRVVIDSALTGGTLLTFETELDLTAAATFTAQLGSAGVVNRILGEQTVSLGGELRLSGARPLATPGLHELSLVEAPEVLGEFDFTPEHGAHLGGRLVFRDIVYTDQSAKLVVEQFAAADLNTDGLIDDLDGAAWSAAYGSTDWRADGNGDGLVDAADYSLWRDAMTATPLAVPEPASASLLLGLLALRRGRETQLQLPTTQVAL